MSILSRIRVFLGLCPVCGKRPKRKLPKCVVCKCRNIRKLHERLNAKHE